MKATVLSRGVVKYALEVVLTFGSVDEILKSVTNQILT